LEGPYRDLGAGFARLTGSEAARRAPEGVRTVEDALVELLKNARDAGARNVYVASTLKERRYRALIVLDDGRGIPPSHAGLIFEPGVTTRHLPADDTPNPTTPGAGLSLYHIKLAALSADLLSGGAASGAPLTALRAVFDTHRLPEKTLQHRPSKSNLPAATADFALTNQRLRLYHSSPARILARLLIDRIILSGRQGGARGVWGEAEALGFGLSLRTVQRVLAGGIPAAGRVVEGWGGVGEAGVADAGSVRGAPSPAGGGGPILRLGAEEVRRLRGVLMDAAGASYLELAGLDLKERPGEVVITARIREPEEEYGDYD
jgi:hypothetical protein